MARLATFADVAGTALQGFQRGEKVREDLRRQKTLAQIAQGLEGGDFRAGAQTAFQAGDVGTGVKLAQIAMQQDKANQVTLPKAPTGFTFNDPTNPAAGVTPLPGFIEAKERLSRAGAPSITNTTNIAAPKFQSKFDETTGKQLGEQALEIAKAGAAASGKIGTLRRMKSALDTGIATGFGQKQLLTLRRAGQTLGIETKGLGETEMLEALGNRMALEMRNPSGGAGMPGAMSDKDREFLSASVPGLDKTREGNAKLIEYGIRLEERNQAVAKFAADYRKANNGRLDLQFYDQLAQWSAQNPMFTDADRAAVDAQEQVTQAAPAGNRIRIDLDGNLLQ